MPIFWSLKLINNRIGEIDLSDPYPYLGKQEKAAYQKFRFLKRKRDWLGARLAAKELIREVDNRWKHKELNMIEILNEKSGSPYLNIKDGQGNPGSVSLSHSNGCVLCAYSPDNIQFGVDLELIEARSKEFVEDFFNANEGDQIAKLDAGERDLFITVIWSGKESILKALSSGLRVDTRSVEVILPELSIEHNGWKNLDLKSNLAINNSLSLVWRREENFVLTACIPGGYAKELIRVDL